MHFLDVIVTCSWFLLLVVTTTLEMLSVLKVYAYLEKDIKVWSTGIVLACSRRPFNACVNTQECLMGSQPKWYQIWAVCLWLPCKRVRQLLASLPAAEVQKCRARLFEHLLSWHHVLLFGLFYCAKEILVFSILNTEETTGESFLPIRMDKGYQHNKN